MFARQLGWYHSTPEDEKQTRAEKFKTQTEGLELDLPKCEAEYLVPFFIEAGRFTATGNGIVALSWVDINAWVEATEKNLSVWEKQTIKLMSEHYVNEYYAGKDKKREAPYISIQTQEILNAKRKAVASAWKSFKANYKNE